MIGVVLWMAQCNKPTADETDIFFSLHGGEKLNCRAYGKELNTRLPNWSIRQVGNWISCLRDGDIQAEKMEKVSNLFIENDINGNILCETTLKELKEEIGVTSLGIRKKILLARNIFLDMEQNAEIQKENIIDGKNMVQKKVCDPTTSENETIKQVISKDSRTVLKKPNTPRINEKRTLITESKTGEASSDQENISIMKQICKNRVVLQPKNCNSFSEFEISKVSEENVVVEEQ